MHIGASALVYCVILILVSYPACSSGFSIMGTSTMANGSSTSAAATYASTRTSLLAIDSSSSDDDSSTLNVFLRLSPLIGGPKFLPLHVEIILSDNTSNGVASATVLHRFDFVPAMPTDPMTLGKLLTLQSVPGLVRYRTFDTYTSCGMSISNDDSLSRLDEFTTIASVKSYANRIVRGRNGITFRLASIDTGSDATSAIISAAETFTRQYQKDRGDLNLVRNSCFTYAYELCKFIKRTG